jgi:hypothetical protein
MVAITRNISLMEIRLLPRLVLAIHSLIFSFYKAIYTIQMRQILQVFIYIQMRGFHLCPHLRTLVNARGASIMDGKGLHCASKWTCEFCSKWACLHASSCFQRSMEPAHLTMKFTRGLVTANYPTFKYNRTTGVSTLVAYTGQADARLFEYNGLLYSMNRDL